MFYMGYSDRRIITHTGVYESNASYFHRNYNRYSVYNKTIG